MTRIGPVLAAAILGLLALPAPAAADITGFLGFSPTPESRSTRGFAVGINIIVVGFEFEYSRTREIEENGVPGLNTYMFNGLVMTPTTGVQLYATAGGGIYRERVGEDTETNFGTNVGGGAKLTLAGPIRLRLDYRVFRLNGEPLHKTAQRFYAGLNINF